MDLSRAICDVPSDWVNDFSQCLFEWQGLEGGVLALLAAGLGSLLLWRQINQSKLHRQDDWTRKHTAAKLSMPLALSGVSEVTQKIADEIAIEIETYQADGDGRDLDAILGTDLDRNKFEPVFIPPDILGTFERFVETLTEPRDIKHLSELIANLQILVSRFNDFDLQQAGAKMGLESLLLQAATVKLLNDSIFNYARSVADGPFGIVGEMSNERAWLEIQRAAQSLIFSRPRPDLFFPAIERSIKHSTEAGTTPWIEKFP